LWKIDWPDLIWRSINCTFSLYRFFNLQFAVFRRKSLPCFSLGIEAEALRSFHIQVSFFLILSLMGLMHLIDFPPVVKRWLSHPIQILSCLGSFQRLSKLWSTGTTRRNVCDGVEVWRSPLAIPSSRAVGGETCCKVHTCLPVGLNRVFMHKRYTDYVLLRIHTNTYIYIYVIYSWYFSPVCGTLSRMIIVTFLL